MIMCNKPWLRFIIKSNTSSSKPSFNRHSFSNLHSPFPKCIGVNLQMNSVSTRKFCTLVNLQYSKPISYNNNVSKINSDLLGGFRFYCAKEDGSPGPPKIMDVPQVIWPSMFKTIRNWILSNFIISRYFDDEFNLQDFVMGSKQAVEQVSGMISRGDTDSLTGLVTPEVISQVRQSLTRFTLKESQEFAVKANDIYFCFPYEVGIMFPNEGVRQGQGDNQSRFVEITMCYHALHGLQQMRDQGMSPPMDMGVHPDFKDNIFILNYRFIREFTKGVQDDWTINAINHFKPAIFV